MAEEFRHLSTAIFQYKMVVVLHNAICQDADFEFVGAIPEQIQELGLVLVLGKYFFSVDTAIHSVVISAFKSQSYSSHTDKNTKIKS
jgi:hypothetical protein